MNREYKRLKETVIPGNYDIFLLWNTDGAPVSISSKAQIWPLQAQISNISPDLRRSYQIVCGLYYSISKKNLA